jgi:hypothetical protein
LVLAGVTLASLAAGVTSWTWWERDRVFIYCAQSRLDVEDGGKRWAPPCPPPVTREALAWLETCVPPNDEPCEQGAFCSDQPIDQLPGFRASWRTALAIEEVFHSEHHVHRAWIARPHDVERWCSR